MVYLFYFCVSICRLNNNLLATQDFEVTFDITAGTVGSYVTNVTTNVAKAGYTPIMVCGSSSGSHDRWNEHFTLISSANNVRTNIYRVNGSAYSGQKTYFKVLYKKS